MISRFGFATFFHSTIFTTKLRIEILKLFFYTIQMKLSDYVWVDNERTNGLESAWSNEKSAAAAAAVCLQLIHCFVKFHGNSEFLSAVVKIEAKTTTKASWFERKRWRKPKKLCCGQCIIEECGFIVGMQSMRFWSTRIKCACLIQAHIETVLHTRIRSQANKYARSCGAFLVPRE